MPTFTAAEVRKFHDYFRERWQHDDQWGPHGATGQLLEMVAAYAARLEQDERFATSAWTARTGEAPDTLTVYRDLPDGSRVQGVLHKGQLLSDVAWTAVPAQPTPA